MQILIATQALNGFEPGDIIAAVPDSHVWGREESLAAWLAAGRAEADFPNPHFAIVQLAGEPCDLNLMEADEEQNVVDADDTNVVSKRAWRLRLDQLPTADRARLTPGAMVALNRSAARSRIQDKQSNRPLPLDASSDGDEVKRRDGTRPGRRPVTRGPA